MADDWNPEVAHLTVDVVLIAYDAAGLERVLLVQRSFDSDAEPGKWALPGGYVDKGEHPADAAVRELAEETGGRAGIKVRPIDLVPLPPAYDPDRDPRGRVVSFPFLCNTYGLPDGLGDVRYAEATDDAVNLWLPKWDEALTADLAFDHYDIVFNARAEHADN